MNDFEEYEEYDESEDLTGWEYEFSVASDV